MQRRQSGRDAGGRARRSGANQDGAGRPARNNENGAAKATAKTEPAPATGQPSGANQFIAEGQAKAHCPTGTVVWANLDSKIFHFTGHADYGHTKKGAYMCEKDATAQGMRAAKNEKQP